MQNKIDTMMNIAKEVSKMSTCRKLSVGAVITSEDFRILSTGYNGSLSGKVHCADYWREVDEETFKLHHHDWSYENEIHAEMNAIFQLYRKEVNMILFCTAIPCINCAKSLLAIGVNDYYLLPTMRRDNGLELLKQDCTVKFL